MQLPTGTLSKILLSDLPTVLTAAIQLFQEIISAFIFVILW